jgi:protease YdgD
LALCEQVGAQQLTTVPNVADGSPQSAIARLNNETGAHCTAALVGPALAVTAAHCLYNARTKHWIGPDSIHLLFGFDRGEYGFHGRVTQYRAGPYDPSKPLETAASDWALLSLTEKPPARFAPLIPATAAYAPDHDFRISGFGSPRIYVISVTGDCTATAEQGILLSQCPSAPGMSGAPLIDTVTGAIIGIEIGVLRGGSRSALVAVPETAWASPGEQRR